MSNKTTSAKNNGQVQTVTLGRSNLPLGGQRFLNFYEIDGQNPNPPRFALDVWDQAPDDFLPPALQEAYGDVIHDAGQWARRCAEYGADIITLHLKSTSPNSLNLGAEQAVKSVRLVLEAVDLPLIVMGVDNADKDVETLSAVAMEFSGRNLALGPVTARNYKRLGAQALAHGHAVIALTPTDFNLAKQLNMLLYNVGLPRNRIIMDATAAALGYGMEYCYSVMEQLNTAAILLDDQEVQHPLISFFGEEVWKTKEAREVEGGDSGPGVMMEAAEAVAMMLAGASVLGLRHPKALGIARDFLKEFN